MTDGVTDRGMRRLFFALWPDERLRRVLNREAGRLHESWGGRRMHADNLHVTLVFLGDVPDARRDAVREAAVVHVPGFELVFDRARCWRHNRVGHLAASRLPPALTELVRALETGLHGRGFTLERRPYVPHVTLLRDTRCDECAPPGDETIPGAPLIWRARDFVLVESVRGVGYRVIERWPLTPPGLARPQGRDGEC